MGRITLDGSVANEDQKHQIAKIAATIVNKSMVQSRVRILPAPDFWCVD
jgi:hypothetical protein